MRRRASLAVFVALAGVMASHRRGVAAVRIETSLQESVFDQAEVDSPNLTIGDAPQRLLIVALATGNLNAHTQQVRWNGEALSLLEGRSLAVVAGTCRLELWVLFDPAPGTGPLVATLSSSTGFGVGAVVYSGVDREAPFTPIVWQTGSGGRISVDLAAPGSRPVLGAACLGGAWTTGPTDTTPEATPGLGEDDLWNFTEPTVVGLGSHRLAMNGGARVSWDVVASEPYQWMAMGFAIKPAGEVLPDAGPDSGAEAGAEDSAAMADRSSGHDSMVQPGPDEADANVDAAGMADVHLRVGCACDTGRSRSSHTGFPLALLGLAVRSRRRNLR
jgi:MYXO-CTERM domain-containing protein